TCIQQRVDDFHAGNGRPTGSSRTWSCSNLPTATAASGASRRATTATSAEPASSATCGGSTPAIYRDPKRGASPPIPKIEIGSFIHQELCNVVMLIVQSDHQRRNALRRRPIHVGSGCDQVLDTFIAAAARSV